MVPEAVPTAMIGVTMADPAASVSFSPAHRQPQPSPSGAPCLQAKDTKQPLLFLLWTRMALCVFAVGVVQCYISFTAHHSMHISKNRDSVEYLLGGSSTVGCYDDAGAHFVQDQLG